MNDTEKKMGLAVFKVFLLLFFLMAFAKSKVHGMSYADGSYSDMTVKVSLYGFIFGKEELYGTISFNGLMFVGFIAYLCHIVVSFLCSAQPSRVLHKISIATALVSAFGLSPIGIISGIKQYNSHASTFYYNHRISMNMKPWLLLIILIIFAIVAYVEYVNYCADSGNLEVEKIKKSGNVNSGSKEIAGILLLVVGIIIYILSIKNLSQSIANGGSMSSGIFMILLGSTAMSIGGYLIYKSNAEAKAAKAQQDKVKRETEMKKTVARSLEIAQTNDLENVAVNIAFKKKYSISFLDFKHKICLAKSVYLFNESSVLHDVKKIQLQNKDYVLVTNNTMSIHKLIHTSTWTDETLSLYKRITLSDIEKVLLPYDQLEYVEYVNDTSSYTIGKKPGTLGLAVHEGLFGTASAINKANNSVRTYTNDFSFIRFVFSPKSGFSSLKYSLNTREKMGEQYFEGLLKEIWEEKEVSRVRNRMIINSNNASNNTNNSMDEFEKIRKMKELYDDGIITKEEYEAAKKKLLS